MCLAYSRLFKNATLGGVFARRLPEGLAITPTRMMQPLEPPRAPWGARGAACRPGQTSRLIGCGMLPPSSRPASGRPLIPPDEARGLCIAQAQTQTWRDWHKPSLAMRLLRRFGCRQTAPSIDHLLRGRSEISVCRFLHRIRHWHQMPI